jgi:hypothetical protein
VGDGLWGSPAIVLSELVYHLVARNVFSSLVNAKMMESSLPSYSQATQQDVLSIIAPYARSQDLCSVALVCRQWNLIFTRQIWGNPASHFGTESDAVYVALVRFKRTLPWARLTTRELTHTLCLPPAQAELYDGPKPEWLGEILSRLPCLQSLIVYALPRIPMQGFFLMKLDPVSHFLTTAVY